MHRRPDRLTYYMTLARQVAERSTCERAKVGAILVSNNRIVSTGYNGAPRGAVHCIDEGCLMHYGHCIRTIHAELNAILHLEHNYPDLILYCTHQPCLHCFKALVSIGVCEIYFHRPYEDEGRELLRKDLGHTPLMLYIPEVDNG